MTRGHFALAAALLVIIAPAGLAGQTSKPAAKVVPQPIRLVVAPSGNEARYIVREQLARVELPGDAIGVTRAITGQIVFDGNGGVDSTASRIVIDLTTLTSDRANRDRWIKRNTIVVDSFPNAELVVTEIRGLPVTLPTSGTLSFTVLGRMSMHGTTTRTTWEVTAAANGDAFTGKATTHVKFGDFGMQQPKVMMVLSIVDDLKLEYDFHLVRQVPSPSP
jgi:polyisoprenoid-binding protein YceI